MDNLNESRMKQIKAEISLDDLEKLPIYAFFSTQKEPVTKNNLGVYTALWYEGPMKIAEYINNGQRLKLGYDSTSMIWFLEKWHEGTYAKSWKQGEKHWGESQCHDGSSENKEKWSFSPTEEIYEYSHLETDNNYGLRTGNKDGVSWKENWYKKPGDSAVEKSWVSSTANWGEKQGIIGSKTWSLTWREEGGKYEEKTKNEDSGRAWGYIKGKDGKKEWFENWSSSDKEKTSDKWWQENGKKWGIKRIIRGSNEDIEEWEGNQSSRRVIKKSNSLSKSRFLSPQLSVRESKPIDEFIVLQSDQSIAPLISNIKPKKSINQIHEKHKSRDDEYQRLIQDETHLHPLNSNTKSLSNKTLSNISQISVTEQENKDQNDENQEIPTERIPELVNYLQIRIRTNMEKVEEYTDEYPLLELRKAILRIAKGISEIFKLIINSAVFQIIIILVILFNTVILALEDPRDTILPYPYNKIELFFVYFYTAEFAMIAGANGLFLNSDSYFRDWWNILDFTILVTAWLSAFAGSGFRLSSLRSLRILRPLKSISSIRGMKALVFALLNSIKPLLSAFFILFFFILIFAIAAVQLWMGLLTNRCVNIHDGIYSDTGLVCGAEKCPINYECISSLDNPNYGVTNFDNIFISLVTIFQIITLEGWTTVMYITQTASSYYVIFFYMPLIFIAANLILNFTLAIITISFEIISSSMIEKRNNELESVSDPIFRTIYNNTVKFPLESKNSEEKAHINPNNAKSQEEETEKLEFTIKNIKFNKNIHQIVRPSWIIGEAYEVENDDYYRFETERFEGKNAIDSNSRITKQLTDSSKVPPIFNKKSSECQPSFLIEPQYSYMRDLLYVGKAETKEIITEQPDPETTKKKRRSYSRLKSAITIKHKDQDILKKNPSTLKRSRLELLESYKITSGSSLEILPIPIKPNIGSMYCFSYRDYDQHDPMLVFYGKMVKKTFRKFKEFKNKYKLFHFLAMRFQRSEAFFLINIPAKAVVQECTVDGNWVEGCWSGADVMNVLEDKKDDEIKKKLSECSFRLWEKGMIGLFQKIFYPLKVLNTHRYTNFIVILAVLINTASLSVEHYGISNESENLLQNINVFFTYFFTVELFLKILGLGYKEFLRDFMNYFDTIVVTLSLVELFIISGGTSAITAFRAIRIFRIFRVLRVVRIFRYLKSMTRILLSLGNSISNFAYLFLLLILFQIIFTLINMQIFGGTFNFPEGVPRGNFDSFHWAFVTTFQILSTENWNDVLTSSLRSDIGPWSCLILILWIILGNFILLNLFLAILLDSFNEDSEDSEAATNKYMENSKIQKKIKDLEDFHDSDSEMIESDSRRRRYSTFEKIECKRSFYIFSKGNIIRIWCYKLSVSWRFENFLLFIIMMNSLKLVWDTYILSYSSDSIQVKISDGIDTGFTILFTIEFIVKSIAFGFFNENNSYLKDNWNKLDFLIVVASLVDMSITSINIPIIKIFRILRALRPLKLIKHNVSMKIVVFALLESIGVIFNVMIIIFIVWLIFAILGVSLLAGKMYYCSDGNFLDIDSCLQAGHIWTNTDSNFDNVLQAMITLFIVMSQESWPNRMFEGVDAKGVGVAPEINANPYMAYFYVIYLILANFFLVNMFTVVVFDKFNQAKKNESSLSALLLTKEQLLWTEIQKMIVTARPGIDAVGLPKNILRKFMYRLSKSKVFEIFIMGFIIINMLSMALAYQQASQEYQDSLVYINLICTFVFIGEAIIKIIGLGFIYFKSSWNIFDFIIALTSLIDIIIGYSSTTSVPLLRVGPQLIRVFRVIRVSRLLRLVKFLDTLQKLLLIMTYSLPAILNVLGLLLLIFFIYAVLGSFLFYSITSGNAINSYFNFWNFDNSMTILWRISTGEDYPTIMWDCTNALDSYLVTFYFTTFVGIIDFIVLDLFISIILQNYEEFASNPYNSVALFTKDIKIYKKYWSEGNPSSKNYKISKEKLVDFIGKAGKELKILTDTSRLGIIKALGSMNIEMDEDENFYFNDVLYAVLKKKYFKKGIDKKRIIVKLVRMEEFKTKKALKKIRENYLKSKQFADDSNNLFLNTIILKSIFKSWKNYTSKHRGVESSITPQFSEVEFPGDNSLI
ncbi:hypothetical protein SteCoe_3461 [Stentor coeruleus]|uniref:Ion transport domain-containing protein n=1 Tax=Stentor coeruleus TaxID=5963 RepID=A0A1R2CWV0_9CILI|nr:hypothetical protein SteCoe_3461 [Stentor coeruleus]